VEVPQSIEAVGATIEDAISRGLEALNVQRNEVEIDVLEPGTNRESRVRLTVKPRTATPAPPATPISPAAPVTPPTEAIDTSEDAVVAQRVISQLLEKMHIPAEVVAHRAEMVDEHDERSGPAIVLDVHGEDLGGLIGRRGETLDNLQYLTRLLVAKEIGHYLNLVIDVEGYKSHREQTLQQLALRMAERVASTHKPASLEPMPANERRIIHLALRDHPAVRTESVGNGENRKVTIIPKSH
jgi:spoIIIJ-associated protein